jgi:antitoxin MazE
MRASVIAVGNSKGIRLPAAVLKQCEIADSVELEVKDKMIIIRPVRKTPRKDWGKAFQEMHKCGEDALIIDDSLESGGEEWRW